jgi:hypothetical protein
MWHRNRFGIQLHPASLYRCRQGIGTLLRRNLEGHSIAFRSIPTLCAIILGEQKSDGAGRKGHRKQTTFAFMTTFDFEAEDIGVPQCAPFEVRDGKGSLKTLAAQCFSHEEQAFGDSSRCVGYVVSLDHAA